MNKTHISLDVTNVDAALAFYRDFLQAEPAKVRPGYANFDLDNPPLKLVCCPVLIADISESPSGQLQGACSPEGWFPFKSAQRRRWPLGGSPAGSAANGPQRRCKP